jgi:hypothetical protein
VWLINQPKKNLGGRIFIFFKNLEKPPKSSLLVGAVHLEKIVQLDGFAT